MGADVVVLQPVVNRSAASCSGKVPRHEAVARNHRFRPIGGEVASDELGGRRFFRARRNHENVLWSGVTFAR